jgi:hypothetical protein
MVIARLSHNERFEFPGLGIDSTCPVSTYITAEGEQIPGSVPLNRNPDHQRLRGSCQQALPASEMAGEDPLLHPDREKPGTAPTRRP